MRAISGLRIPPHEERKMKLSAAPLFLALIAVFASAPVAISANVADFRDFSLTVNGSVALPGRLYVPPEAASNPAQPRPFITFLHGGGESGSNNVGQLSSNIDNLLAEAKRRGAYLYAPQTPNNWSSAILTDRVMTMIDRALVEQNVDSTRLYITGLSNGGGGTWNMLSRYPDRFAAGIPICGVAPASDFVPARLLDQAIASFHARNDTVVSVGTSRTVINRILAAAGQTAPIYPSSASAPDFVYTSPTLDVSYVEPALGGHGIWGLVYNTPPLYSWLFAHTTAVPEPGALLTAGVSVAALFMARPRPRRYHLT
jgi:predicted peptidase